METHPWAPWLSLRAQVLCCLPPSVLGACPRAVGTDATGTGWAVTPTSWRWFPSCQPGTWPRPCPSGIDGYLVPAGNGDQRVGFEAGPTVRKLHSVPTFPGFHHGGGQGGNLKASQAEGPFLRKLPRLLRTPPPKKKKKALDTSLWPGLNFTKLCQARTPPSWDISPHKAGPESDRGGINK